ncbi:hypothetical protein CY658_05105 [Variovorax sp. RO1]|nr:hypothetical protein CY658_05105 [Variovorax sp. RO1]
MLLGASWGTLPDAWTAATAMAVYRKNGQSFYDGGNFNAGGSAWSAGDVIGVVVSHTGAFVRFYRNNTLITTITATAPGANSKPAYWAETNMGGVVTLRTKLAEFSYALPAGSSAWE